jgi:hypothetical protein
MNLIKGDILGWGLAILAVLSMVAIGDSPF